MRIQKKIVILLIATFISNAHSQDVIDAIGDSIKKNIYSNPEKAVTFCHEYIKLNKEINAKENLSIAYAALAIAHETMGELDSVSYYYSKRMYLSNKPIDSIKNTYYIARIYDSNYKYNEALKLYKTLLELVRKEGIDSFSDEIEFLIEIIKSKIEAHKIVPEHILVLLEETYNKSVKENNLKRERYIRKKLIDAYLQSNKSEKALPLVEKGMLQAKTNNNLKYLYYMLSSRAKIYTINNNTALAINDLESALTCASTLKNSAFNEQAKFELANIAYKQGDYKEAITHLKGLENEASKTTAFQLSKNYKLLADTYREIGDIELSNNYFSKYSKAKEAYSKAYFNLIDDIYKITLTEKVLDLKEDHKSDLEKEISEKKAQEKTKRFWTRLSISLIVLVLIIVLYFKKKAKKNQKRFNELMVKINTYENTKLKTIEDEAKFNIVKTIKNEATKPQNSIDINTVETLLNKLQKLESTNYFLRKDCTLHSTAKKLKTNTSYLSKIINTHLEKSFSTYINELRINYVLIELKNNKRLRSYSIKAISEEIGYKNSDAFGRYFKAETGISPSVYIKKIKNENF